MQKLIVCKGKSDYIGICKCSEITDIFSVVKMELAD